MDIIRLNRVVPQIFSNREDLSGDIWGKDFSFERGKHYLINASSGTGKSTLCSYLYGQRGDYQGTILFDNSDISTLSTNQWCEIRQQSISHLFQDLKLFGELTALQNVEIKNNITHSKSQSEILALFEELGISDKIDTRIDRISFGQQQRVALIRALCQPYSFLLLDEPISHLDDANSEIMRTIIERDAKAKGAGIIATSIGKHINFDYDLCLNL
jgi:ABC-type lipoprotein export system ATPase subunit